ncbi:VOC family protein [Segeticoccus rhizosphaerae]|jgi:catechol 2,3-dioxygenase-like lactoylglutathione lyase family enzyme|uniref:VOC family protein n=1 Tax=Segeticoccus rhizosphaerae TaxID=1104777 RepID=UPI0010C04115|nr:MULTISPECIES: VOC family protein [Intrasporangiaceae]
MPTIEAFSHVTLTVRDLESSVAWYARALGMTRGPDMSGPGWRRTLMLAAGGVVIGLQAHDRTPEGDRFDETRVGLDHLSIACKDRAEIEEWIAELDGAGLAHSTLSAAPANVATCRDPDGIAIEFFAPRGA